MDKASEVESPNEDESKTIALLHEKIRSKMNVAQISGTLVAGFLAAIIAFAASRTNSIFVAGRESLVVLSIGSLVISTVLFFSTMFRYDALLIPGRYWRKGEYGPNQLFQKMIEAWRRLFVPAIFFTALSLAMFACAVVPADYLNRVIGADGLVTAAIGVALAVVAAFIWGVLAARIPINWDYYKPPSLLDTLGLKAKTSEHDNDHQASQQPEPEPPT